MSFTVLAHQREAHRRSAEVRTRFSALKRQLWVGEISFADVDLDAPWLDRRRVLDLLIVTAPGSHPRTTSRSPSPGERSYRWAYGVLAAFGASPRITFGRLSAARKQRLRDLVAVMEAR